MFLLKRFAVLIVSSVLLSSCLGKYVENDLDALAKNEEIKIVEYGQTNSLTLTKNASTGIYYNISKTNSAGLAVSSAYDLLLAYSLKTIDGKEIIDYVNEWLQKNTYKGRFNMSDATENIIRCEQVRIPLYDSNNNPIDARQFAKGLQKYLKAVPFSFEVKLMTRGLGEAVLVLGEK